MEYISTKEAAAKWHIGQRRVQYLCASGLVDGAKLIGRQWMIPVDAPRPADGRTREGREAVWEEPYKFPFFMHTPYCTKPDYLDEDEKKVLAAHRLYYKCDFAESVRLCRELLDECGREPIRVACHAILAQNSMLLGLRHELSRELSSMRSIVDKATKHKTDYQLVLYALEFERTWDPKDLLSIDVSELSAPATYYYNFLIMLSSAVNQVKESTTAIRSYEVFVHASEGLGLIPTAIESNFIMASILLRNKKLVRFESYIEKGCALAVQYGCVNYLSKYYSLFPELLDKHLSKYDESYVSDVQKFCKQNIFNWRVATSDDLRKAPLQDFIIEDVELLLLLINDYDDEAIATFMGIDANTVSEKIVIASQNAKVGSREELVQFAKDQVEMHLLSV